MIKIIFFSLLFYCVGWYIRDLDDIDKNKTKVVQSSSREQSSKKKRDIKNQLFFIVDKSGFNTDKTVMPRSCDRQLGDFRNCIFERTQYSLSCAELSDQGGQVSTKLEEYCKKYFTLDKCKESYYKTHPFHWEFVKKQVYYRYQKMRAEKKCLGDEKENKPFIIVEPSCDQQINSFENCVLESIDNQTCHNFSNTEYSVGRGIVIYCSIKALFIPDYHIKCKTELRLRYPKFLKKLHKKQSETIARCI